MQFKGGDNALEGKFFQVINFATIAVAASEERVADSERRLTQTPRVFYRREFEARP